MKYHLAVLLSLIFFSVAIAQQNPDSTIVHSLRSGSWAIQFGVGSNFTLQTFNSSTISLKRHSTPNSAWRLGISFDGETEDRDTDSAGKPGYGDLINGKSNRFNLRISAQYLYYPNPDKNIKLFLGAGPELGISHRYIDQVIDSYREDTLFALVDRHNKSNGYSLGLSFHAGIEYFITTNISLHAEYRSSVLFMKSRDDIKDKVDYINSNYDDRDTHRKEEYHRFHLISNYVMFGLSAYF